MNTLKNMPWLTRAKISLSLVALITLPWSPQPTYAANEPQIAISGPDSDGITSIGICLTNPSEVIGSSVRFSSDYLGSGSFSVHSGTPACPSFGGVSIGQRLTSGQTYIFSASVTVGGQTFSISRTYTAAGEDPAVVAARQLRASQDADFRARQDAAIASATAESQAWNAANPGKQKCVQWGPLVHANGVSTASGGVCANPVEPGPGTTVSSQPAPSVTAPTEPSTTPSSGSSTTSATTTSSTTTSSTTTTSTSSNETTTATSTPSTTGTNISAATAPLEVFPQWGSGTPFTKVLKGQLSTSQCPIGYQAANGVIVAIGTGTFTECWPENAWIAYRLGGNIWDQFKSSGGTYDAKAEETRRNKVTELKALAKSVAQKAADETPGIQRCSNWSGYGESGQECAYTFVKPQSNTTLTATPINPASDSRTITTTVVQPNQSTNQTSTINDSSEPFPNLRNGDEIPGTRITSSRGISQSEWESTSLYKSLSCPSGSGKATGVDLNGSVSASDDSWFAYCIKSWSARVSAATSDTATSGSSNSTSNITSTSTNSAANSSTTMQTGSTNSVESTSKVDSQTATTSNVASPTPVTPTLASVAIQVSGTSNEVKTLIGKVVEETREQNAMVNLISLLEKSASSTTVKNVKLPSSQKVDEKATSDTPDICKVDGLNVTSLKKGTCIISYTVADSDGNTFTTKKSIIFKK